MLHSWYICMVVIEKKHMHGDTSSATGGTALAGDVEVTERSDSLHGAAETVHGELSATGGTAREGDVSGRKK